MAVCLLAANLFPSQPARAASAVRMPMRIYICQGDWPSTQPWRRSLERGVAEAIAPPPGSRLMGDATCGTFTPENACVAGVYDTGGRVLTCAPRAMMQAVRASAWYAIEHARTPNESYEAFRARHGERTGLKVFQISAAQTGPAQFEDDLEVLRTHAEAVDTGQPDRQIAEFRAIFGLVLAAFLGHESAHLEAGPPFCPITTPSRAEESGLFAISLRVAGSGELFASRKPLIAEVTADRCAARHVRAFSEAGFAPELSEQDRIFARRAAAEIIAHLLAIRPASGQAKAQWVRNDAYLQPPLRILILAGEMNAGLSEPTFCGGAAEALGQSLQTSYRAEPGEGALPDDLEAFFPKGVIDALNSKRNWDSDVYSCQ